MRNSRRHPELRRFANCMHSGAEFLQFSRCIFSNMYYIYKHTYIPALVVASYPRRAKYSQVHVTRLHVTRPQKDGVSDGRTDPKKASGMYRDQPFGLLERFRFPDDFRLVVKFQLIKHSPGSLIDQGNSSEHTTVQYATNFTASK